VDALSSVVGFSGPEAALVTQWSSPPSWDPDPAAGASPPGRGKFLIKVGGRPGIPVLVLLTPRELALNNTNQRWEGM